MAIAVARVLQGGLPHTIHGAHKRTVTDVTLDADYVTGGYPITAAQLGLSAVVSAQAEIITSSGAGVNIASVGCIPQVNGSLLLKAHDETPAEVASSGDIATTVVKVQAEGW